jgi:hypothetical protein
LLLLFGGATDARCCSLHVFRQGGGFSPKRLRAMLLGVERRRKDAGAGEDDDGEQEEEYGAVPMASVRSDAADSDARSEHPYSCPIALHCSIWTIFSVSFGFRLLFQSVSHLHPWLFICI